MSIEQTVISRHDYTSLNTSTHNSTHDSLQKSLYKMITGPNELYVKINPVSNLIAIISIDRANSEYKSALGGTRCIYYSSIEDAIFDAVKLSRAMTYKAKFAELPFNGGKAVLIKPSKNVDKHNYFLEYGQFIESLEGRIITGCDSGVSPEDLQIAAKNTNYITALTSHDNIDHLASLTVAGVLEAMKAAALFKFGKSNLSGLKIAVQGLGKVGYLLASVLYEQGAKLTVTDIDLQRTHLFQEKCKTHKTQVVEPSHIHKGEYDIFAPCGLGEVINNATITDINAKIICGSANNILASEEMDDLLYKRNIIYIPDFIANVGGAVFAGNSYLGHPLEHAQKWIEDNIHKKVLDLLTYSKDHNLPYNLAAQCLMK